MTTSTLTVPRPSRVTPGIATIKATRLWMAGDVVGLDASAQAVTALARQVEALRSVVATDRSALAVAMLSAGYTQADTRDLLGGISRTRLGHLIAAAAG